MAEYNFKTGVDAGEYRDFLNVSPAYCFTQLPEWSEVKDNWDCLLYTSLLGNEAVARGLYEAGCRVASSYPGTPSTEVTESAAKYDLSLIHI